MLSLGGEDIDAVLDAQLAASMADQSQDRPLVAPIWTSKLDILYVDL